MERSARRAVHLAVEAMKPGEPTTEELETMARMCRGKKRFCGESTALKVAQRYQQRAYWCPICKGWHCTHVMPEWKPRR